MNDLVFEVRISLDEMEYYPLIKKSYETNYLWLLELFRAFIPANLELIEEYLQEVENDRNLLAQNEGNLSVIP